MAFRLSGLSRSESCVMSNESAQNWNAPSRWLAERALYGLCVWTYSDDLRKGPMGLVFCASEYDFLEVSLDLPGIRKEIADWLQRNDRVVVMDSARRQLRHLLAADIDVARPVCLQTLARLAGEDPGEERNPPRDAAGAKRRALEALQALSPTMDAVANREQQKVARLESLVLRAFAALEHRGLAIDEVGWRALVHEAVEKRDRARREVFLSLEDVVSRDLFGEPDLSLDNDADVRGAIQKATKIALPDVSKSTLKDLDHPVGPALLRYRESSKIVSTYGDAFLELIHPDTQRFHATFYPLGASTGRVSSRNPNLQNLPSDERFHRCLRAPENRAMVTADYATCELRILAEFSADPHFISAFEQGEDLHSAVASTLFGEKVSKSENSHLRQAAKAINFGLVYGMGVTALANSLGRDLEEAEALLAQYFARFPKIRGYLEESVDRALARGYAETALGRRLYFDPETLKGSNARGELSRIAKNMPIQGTSADMTKLAMVRVHERLLGDFSDAGLVNTIHDELVVECDANEADAVAIAVQQEMSEAHRTLVRRVPPVVEVHVGPTWQH